MFKEDLFSYSIEKEKIGIKFAGDNHIEIEPLISLLKSFQTSVVATSEAIDSFSNIKIFISEVRPGNSSTTFFEIVKEVAFGVTSDILILGIVQGIMALRKHFKGKKPNSIEPDLTNKGNFNVSNYYGEVQNINADVVNIYLSNPGIDKELVSLAKQMKSSGRKELQIDISNESVPSESLLFTESDIDYLSQSIDVEGIDVVPRTMVERETLQLISPKYQSSAKWEFKTIYGARIKAQILDFTFLSQVNSGMTGTTGKTELVVDLKTVINTGLNTKNRPASNRYFIEKVHSIRNLSDDETTLFNYDFSDN